MDPTIPKARDAPVLFVCLGTILSLYFPITVIAHLVILAKEGSGSALRLINDS